MKRNTHTQVTYTLDHHEVEEMVTAYLAGRGYQIAGEFSLIAGTNTGNPALRDVRTLQVQVIQSATEEK